MIENAKAVTKLVAVEVVDKVVEVVVDTDVGVDVEAEAGGYKGCKNNNNGNSKKSCNMSEISSVKNEPISDNPISAKTPMKKIENPLRAWHAGLGFSRSVDQG